MFTPHLYREFLKYATPYQQAKMLKMPVVDGDGAMGRMMRESYDLLAQLPAFTPPFEQMWIELGKMKLKGFDDSHYAGVIVSCIDVREEKAEVAGLVFGWVVDLECYVDTIPAQSRTFVGRLQLALLPTGELPRHTQGGISIGEMTINTHMLKMIDEAIRQKRHQLEGVTPEEYTREVEYGLRKMIEACSLAALFVLGMLHCKNVELEEQVASAKVQRHRAKHGKSPEERFYTLKVTGKGARAGSLALRVPSGARNAMHWCRGHFRKYTEDAPLFGKIVGTFWVDAHVRGDRNEGQINKAYTVDFSRPIPQGRSEV